MANAPGEQDAEPGDEVRVFMSYRRADDRHFVGRLHDRLCESFGDSHVFRDIDSIQAGTSFRAVILDTLAQVDLVVAVIGKKWLSDRRSGQDDFVYLELGEALDRGTPVIPVLIDDTPMPRPSQLPERLRRLSDLQAVTVGADPAFRRDSLRLMEAIRIRALEHRARPVVPALPAIEPDPPASPVEIPTVEAVVVPAPSIAPATPATPATPMSTLHDAPPVTVARRVPLRSPFDTVGLLCIAAAAVSIVAMITNHAESGYTSWNELSGTRGEDVLEWFGLVALLTPLALRSRPSVRRGVLAGLMLGTLFEQLLGGWATGHFGGAALTEGRWVLLRLAGVALLAAAWWRTRGDGQTASDAPMPSFPLLLGLAVVTSGAIVLATVMGRYNARELADHGKVGGLTDVATWLLLDAVGPAVALVTCAVLGTFAARLVLTTLAIYLTLALCSEMLWVSYTFDESLELGGAPYWLGAAVAALALSVTAGLTLLPRLRPTRA